MPGELAKLIIRGYDKPEELAQQGKPVAEFQAMFNPETFSVSNTFEYDDARSDAETGSEQKSKNLSPREFSYEFLIDGTNASGVPKDVKEQVEAFERATGFFGKERRPLYLAISWGTFTMRCVLKKMEVKYTLFRNDGKPVRGVIVASFAEYKPPEQQLAENPDLASKLTRFTESTTGQSLDLLAHTSYGDSSKLVDIAKANGLNSLKSVANDQRLELPSTDQLQSQASTLQEQAESEIQEGLSNLF